MKTKNILGIVLIVSLFTIVGCKSSQAKLQAEARISRAEAEKTALTKVPGGTIKEGELEKEHGKLVWSFDIASNATKDITEVQVNALTGEIVSVETETPAHEAKERMESPKSR